MGPFLQKIVRPLSYAQEFSKEFRELANGTGWFPEEIPNEHDERLIIYTIVLAAFFHGAPLVIVPYNFLQNKGIRACIPRYAGAFKHAILVFFIILAYRILIKWWEMGEIVRQIVAVRGKVWKVAVAAETTFQKDGEETGTAMQMLEEECRKGELWYDKCKRLDDGCWEFKGIHVPEPLFGNTIRMDAVFGSNCYCQGEITWEKEVEDDVEE